MSEFTIALPFLLMGVVVLGAWWFLRHHARRVEEALARLAARDGLTPTHEACGRDAQALVDRYACTPRGARRYGLRYGLVGACEVELDGRAAHVEVATFEWWYEERVRNQNRTSYRTRRSTVAAARLPVTLPGTIAIKPEGVLGRLGLRRADQQLESEEFNRRFNVQGSDPQLTVRFLDAGMQHRLLEHGTRSVDLDGDLVLLGGRPTHRDATLPRVLAEHPAARQDLVGLLRAVPAGVWRAARREDRSDAHGEWSSDDRPDRSGGAA